MAAVSHQEVAESTTRRQVKSGQFELSKFRYSDLFDRTSCLLATEFFKKSPIDGCRNSYFKFSHDVDIKATDFEEFQPFGDLTLRFSYRNQYAS